MRRLATVALFGPHPVLTLEQFAVFAADHPDGVGAHPKAPSQDRGTQHESVNRMTLEWQPGGHAPHWWTLAEVLDPLKSSMASPNTST